MFGRSDDSPRWQWSFSSQKDPRFTDSGTAYGMFGAEAQINEAIAALEKQHACKAPDDIVFGGVKE